MGMVVCLFSRTKLLAPQMLFETLEYYENLSRCPRYLKDYEQIKELIAIKARYKRCLNHWKPHLDNSKNFINQNIDKNPSIFGSSYVVVLGAGMANDLDLYFLTDHFEKVILSDLFFLKNTREALSFYPNIFYSEFDVTDCMERILDLVSRYKNNYSAFLERLKDFVDERNNFSVIIKQHPLIKITASNETQNVISLNLLSQLPLSFAKLFEKYFKAEYKEEDCSFFYKMIIKEHLSILNHLKKLGKTVLVISDSHKYVSDRRGKEIAQESSLFGISLKQNLLNIKEQKNWYWDLAPLGEVSNSYSLRLMVNAYKL